MRKHSRFAIRALVLGALAAGAAGTALCSPSGASAAPPRAPIGPANGGAAVRLAGSLHPFAQPSADAGRADPGKRLTSVSLLFRTTPVQKAAIAALQIALQDPMSGAYHQWLTPERYAAQFGASAADIARATAWLQSQGLDVVGPSRLGTRLEFNGTVAQIERAFATEIHLYDVDGVRHFANSIAPSIPADLAGFVMGVHNLHDFKPKPPPHPQYSLPFPGLDGGLTNIPAMGQPDFATIYGLKSLYQSGITGAGQHLAIAGQTDFNDADIQNFRSTFGLDTTNIPARHLVPNSGNAFVSPNDITESELDLEVSGGVAEAATVDFVFTGDNSAGGVFDAMTYAVEQHIAPIVSVSYGYGETSLDPADAVFNESLGDAASVMGISILAAAGDTGAADADSQRSKAARHGKVVDWPGSIPTFVSVGGTQFQLDEMNPSPPLDSNYDALGYIAESGWNETAFDEDAGVGGLGAGGGGVSKIFAKPYWQIPYTPNDNFRDVPDVALSASAEIYPYVVSYSWTAADGDAQAPQPEALTAIGGTSAAAPSFAGMLALVNQSLVSANPGLQPGLGNPNPILYAMANNAATKAAFNDVTTGDNIVPCLPGTPDCPSSPPYQFGYSCGPGYDQVTGNGSINAAAFVQAWTTLAPTSTALQVMESGTTEGSPITLQATVSSMATSNALTGDVTFYFFTYDAMGNTDLSGVLGSVAVTPSTSGKEGGTAMLTAKAPAGLLQADAGLEGGAKIGAVYGGDLHYLPSWSTLSQVQGTSDLSICPQTVTLQPTQSGFQFRATGGTGVIQWGVINDSTCARETAKGPDGGPTHVEVCSTITDAGVFTAGPAQGTAQVVAFDTNYAYSSATVTVAGSADGGAPLPAACPPPDAGSGSPADSGPPVDEASVPMADAGLEAGGNGDSPGGSSGCGCVTAGGDTSAMGALAGAVLGLAALVRRRRVARDAR